jgi:hypothetical protein
MHYINVPEYKPLHEAPHRRLQELEEARGELLRIFEAEGQVVACFSWGCCSFPGELREELAALVGREIAILRLEGYHIRAVDDA